MFVKYAQNVRKVTDVRSQGATGTIDLNAQEIVNPLFDLPKKDWWCELYQITIRSILTNFRPHQSIMSMGYACLT
jgi:hypothetical protein